MLKIQISKFYITMKQYFPGTVYKYIKHNLNRLVGVTLDDMFEKVNSIHL